MGDKIGLSLTFIGVIFLAGDTSGITLKPELFWGVAAGLCNAGSQLSLFRSTKTTMTPLEINAWGFTVATICLIPVLALKGFSAQDIATFAEPQNHVGVWLAIVALALLIMNTQFFRAKAYQLASSNSQLAPLIFTNLIFTAVWQKLFFDDSFSFHQLLGITLIISASMLQVLIPSIAKLKQEQPLAHR
ncbi:EamA family transporter [Vibrio hannami]|uniref:EamA family transporter n=1 Tax=Vibrio hannami TaxID=2717094 RepID=UPI00240FD904|nr:EamA family transporter [Vibrio hannami]MDG3085395.1 EamA family transporter [Vibrio hannami]